jgi:hypothetical protein
VSNRLVESAFLSVLIAACSAQPESFSANQRNDSSHAEVTLTVTNDSSIARSILDSLKIIAMKSTDEFDTSFVPKVEPTAILTLVSDSGLVLHDVNERDTTIKVTKAAIAEAIEKRRGRVFVALAHFATIYSKPYPQYSRLSFTQTSTGIDVDVGSTYHVRFLRQGDGLRIGRISYTEIEGE